MNQPHTHKDVMANKRRRKCSPGPHSTSSLGVVSLIAAPEQRASLAGVVQHAFAKAHGLLLLGLSLLHILSVVAGVRLTKRDTSTLPVQQARRTATPVQGEAAAAAAAATAAAAAAAGQTFHCGRKRTGDFMEMLTGCLAGSALRHVLAAVG
jgi:hypothetical protein